MLSVDYSQQVFHCSAFRDRVVVRATRGEGREEGGNTGMPTYVTLMNWTDQGVRTVRDTVRRREQADELAQKHGAKIEQVYWTVGPYDIVAIVEAPDDESATSMLLELGSA